MMNRIAGNFKMNRYMIKPMLGVALLLLATLSSANDGETLAKENRCNTCHALSEMEWRVGPPFPAVASRYPSADTEALKKLSAKIIEGGAGVWGFVPMPAQPHISPAQASQLAQWILKQKPAEPKK